MRSTPRALTFLILAAAIPAAACQLLKHDDAADAGATGASTAEQTTTTTATSTAAGSAAPVATALATVTPAATPVAQKTVIVKLPDGGTKSVDAAVLSDGAVVLPPGFQFPSLSGFDAAALPQIPAFKGFDAAGLPAIPTTLPSGFPKFPTTPPK